MQWRNHLHTGFSLGWFLTGSLLGGLVAAWGALLPDRLSLGFRRHRDFTHSPLIWLGLLALLRVLEARLVMVVELVGRLIPVASEVKAAGTVLLGFKALVVGALAHVFCDGLSRAGVPLWPGGRFWIGVPLYGTWEASEDVVAFVITGLAIAGAVLRQKVSFW